MPRETTRQPPHLHLVKGGLDFEIREHDGDVRVALSGTLDRNQLSQLMRQTAPRLSRRGRRVILDGQALEHLDYRVVGDLMDWARDLRAFGHRLLLTEWSTYLRTILVVGARPGWPAISTAGPLVERHGASLS
jgi:anti-anti-sigma regulatory factor